MKKHIHLIGIGGISMSAIASYLVSKNYQVSGSDMVKTPQTDRLKKNGIEVYIGHKKENISKDLSCVIYTSAITPSSPGFIEIKEAKKFGIKSYKRSDFLGYLFNQKDLICISGTHGKSTTSAMVAKILSDNGFDPTVFLGANYKAFSESSFRKGKDKSVVLEACEFDRSFLSFKPTIAIITNIEAEHLDYFKGGIDEIIETFAGFIKKIKPKGYLVYWAKDQKIKKAIQLAKRKDITYIKYAQDINCDILSKLKLKIPGDFNIDNALAALSVAQILEIPEEKIVKSLNDFSGIQRRLELKFEGKGILLFDDYAHHPTEIKATIKGIKNKYPKRRLIVVFQPHQYSRTKLLLKDFCQSFSGADQLILAPVFEVLGREEKKDFGSCELADKIKNLPAIYFSSIPKITDYLFKNTHLGDIVITMGAGDIFKLADELSQKIKHKL